MAQSFSIVDDPGAFVTEVEVFFRTKDPLLPVTVQLRTMVNGYPSNEVYPFGEVIFESDDIEDSLMQQFTYVVFPLPVYLNGNTEHCVVLLSF